MKGKVTVIGSALVLAVLGNLGCMVDGTERAPDGATALLIDPDAGEVIGFVDGEGGAFRFNDGLVIAPGEIETTRASPDRNAEWRGWIGAGDDSASEDGIPPHPVVGPAWIVTRGDEGDGVECYGRCFRANADARCRQVCVSLDD